MDGRPTIADKLVPLLRQAGANIPDAEWTIRRIRPGPAARSAGAWSWCLAPKVFDAKLFDIGSRIGSQHRAKLCLRNFKRSAIYWHDDLTEIVLF